MKKTLQGFAIVFLFWFGLLTVTCEPGDGGRYPFGIEIGAPWGQEPSCMAENAIIAFAAASILAAYGTWRASHPSEELSEAESLKFDLLVLAVYLLVVFATPTASCISGDITPPFGIEIGGPYGRELSCAAGPAIIALVFGVILSTLILRSVDD